MKMLRTKKSRMGVIQIKILNSLRINLSLSRIKMLNNIRNFFPIISSSDIKIRNTISTIINKTTSNRIISYCLRNRILNSLRMSFMNQKLIIIHQSKQRLSNRFLKINILRSSLRKLTSITLKSIKTLKRCKPRKLQLTS